MIRVELCSIIRGKVPSDSLLGILAMRIVLHCSSIKFVIIKLVLGVYLLWF